jgi:hypothetical protein
MEDKTYIPPLIVLQLAASRLLHNCLRRSRYNSLSIENCFACLMDDSIHSTTIITLT